MEEGAGRDIEAEIVVFLDQLLDIDDFIFSGLIGEEPAPPGGGEAA